MAVRVAKPLLSPWKRQEREPTPRARQVAYHRVLVPLGSEREVAQAMEVACRLAADRHAAVTALSVIEVPPELPLAAQMPEEEKEARSRTAQARAVAELYGVSLATRVRYARSAGEAIVEEATDAASEIIVIGAPRTPSTQSRRAPGFGKTVDFVLKHAPCRIVVAALPPGA
jgi:nucleotide-binding universal stress UspA family protein